MLNRKILGLVLPAVAVSALVGSGFSAWYFNEKDITEKEQNVNVFVTDMVDNAVGTLTLNETQATTLTLDQGGFENATLLNKGISFDAASVGAQFKFKENKEAETYNNLTSAGMKVQVTTTVTFTAELLKYVDVIGLSGYDHTPDSNIYTRTQDVVSDAGLTDTIELMSEGNCTFLTYKEGMKPNDSTTYNAMKGALTGAEITFNWSAAVVTK